ncbi:hypothetical protein quinque_011233 [Culex quinquefasciatus]
MGPGKAFGELAILYNCTRTASIRVLCDSRVWVLDRRVFQRIMMRTGLQRIEENVNFLRSVPCSRTSVMTYLPRLRSVLEVEFYPAGAYIIRQGAAETPFPRGERHGEGRSVYQQEHVYSERKIMLACNSPFICRLYPDVSERQVRVHAAGGFGMGGGGLDDSGGSNALEDGTAKFIVGCVLKAFEFLHSRGSIVPRSEAGEPAAGLQRGCTSGLTTICGGRPDENVQHYSKGIDMVNFRSTCPGRQLV